MYSFPYFPTFGFESISDTVLIFYLIKKNNTNLSIVMGTTNLLLSQGCARFAEILTLFI